VDSDSNLFLPSNASNLICDFGLNDNTTKTIGRVATASNGIDTNNQNTEIVCPTPVLNTIPSDEIQQVSIQTAAPMVETQCFEARKLAADRDEIQVITTAATGQLYEIQKLQTVTGASGPEKQIIETTAQCHDEVQSLEMIVSPTIAEVQTLVVSADSDISGSFKIQIHFPSIRQPVVVGGLDLSLAATHETGDIIWNFGPDGPSAASIETALAPFVGAVEVLKHAPESVNSGTTTEYRWDITFTYLQQIDSGNVDSIGVVLALIGDPNVQSNVVEKQRGTSKSYQRVALTPSGTVSGTFALSFRGETTTHLEFDVSSVGMKSQLELLTTIGEVTVTRTGNAATGFVWDIAFDDNIGSLPALIAENTYLNDGTVSATTLFSSPSDEISGTFVLSYRDNNNVVSASSIPINHNASSLELRTALEGIAGMPTGLVRVSTTSPNHNGLFTWAVTFEALRGDAGTIIADITNIKGTTIELVEWLMAVLIECIWCTNSFFFFTWI
jgi:hypothetical protein